MDDYISFHESIEGGGKTQVSEYQLTADESAQIQTAVYQYPTAASLTCATSVGTILRSLSKFDELPKYEGITLPGTLYDDLQH